MQAVPMLASLWSDGRHAARLLRKQPTFAAAVVPTLALGIGANTALFSLLQCRAADPSPTPIPIAW